MLKTTPFMAGLAGLVIVISAATTGPRLGAATVTIDGSQTFQLIDGFGANVNHWNTNEIGPVLDALVDQAGLTIFRVLHDSVNWETSNDDTNPLVMNWDYYNSLYSNPDWERMWDTIAYLNQKGITNGITVNFMGLPPARLVTSPPSFLLPGLEPEWAEMIASAVVYARNTRHLQFSLLEPDNEPDMMSGVEHLHLTLNQQLASLHAMSQLLDAHGLSDIRFVGPDLGFTSNSWISAWLNDPALMAKVAHIGLHCYDDNFGGPSTGVYSLLQQSSYTNLTFWMTEYNQWCSSCEGGGCGDNSWSFARGSVTYLLHHLANGASAGLVFTGCDTWMDYLNAWSYWGLFAVDNPNASPKSFTPRKGFYTLSQVSKFVRPGSRRIGLSGSTSPFTLLAFYHPVTGQLVVVGVNPGFAAPLSASLVSLSPASTLDLYYTSSSVNLSSAGAVSVTNRLFATTIPADCVFTLVSRPAVSVLLNNPPEGAILQAGAACCLQATPIAAAGTVSNVAFYAGGMKLGDAAVPPYALEWTNAPPGAFALRAWATNSLGNTASSPPVHVVVVGPFNILNVSASDNLLGLTWESVPGRVYCVQRKDGLGHTNWQDLAPEIQAAGATTSFSLPIDKATSHLYRIKILR
jgi:O-glycosyl hydrolase